MWDWIGCGARLRGQVEKLDDDPMAYPPVAAIFSRQTHGGRNGRLILPFVLTTSEWNLYTRQGVLPLRFQRPGDRSESALYQDLLAAIAPYGGTYVMPRGEGHTDESLRAVCDFFFLEFQVNPLKAKRKKSSVAVKRAAERRALLYPEAASLEKAVPAKPRTKAPIPGLVYLLQAGQHFKIGMTINLDKRLTQIKLQLPFPVTLIHTIQAAHPVQAESHWHRRFASLRLNGEWFALGPTEVNEFKSVSEM